MELKLLKSKNLKITQQRIDILKEIISLDTEATIKNICDELTHIDKSTIYRTLETLEKNDIIAKNTSIDSKVFYEVKKEHSHYLYCVECKKRIETKHCFFHEEHLDGFIVLDHTFEVHGICKDCQKKKNR